MDSNHAKDEPDKKKHENRKQDGGAVFGLAPTLDDFLDEVGLAGADPAVRQATAVAVETFFTGVINSALHRSLCAAQLELNNSTESEPSEEDESDKYETVWLEEQGEQNFVPSLNEDEVEYEEDPLDDIELEMIKIHGGFQ